MINNLDGSCSCQQTTCLCQSGYSWSKILNLCAPLYGISDFQVIIGIQNGNIAQAIITAYGIPLNDISVFEFLVTSLVNFANTSYNSICDFDQIGQAGVILMTAYPEYLFYDTAKYIYSITNFTVVDYQFNSQISSCNNTISSFINLCIEFLKSKSHYLNDIQAVDQRLNNYFANMIHFTDFEQGEYYFNSSNNDVHVTIEVYEGSEFGCSNIDIISAIWIEYKALNNYSDIISLNYYKQGTISNSFWYYDTPVKISICDSEIYELVTYSISNHFQSCIYFNPCQIVSINSDSTDILLNSTGLYALGPIDNCTQGFGHDNFGNCVSCYDQNCKFCSDFYKNCSSCMNDSMIIINGVCECPAGQRFSENLCVSCENNCKSCDSNNNCIECLDPKMTKISNGSCYYVCNENCIDCSHSYPLCDECYYNAIHNDGNCTCPLFSYSDTVKQTCECIEGYTFNDTKFCVLKGNYFYPSEISGFYAADYKSIVINFQRQVGQSLTQINCNNTLKSFSISFNGLVGTCVWTSSTSMTIQYATIISPQNLIISLNPLQVQAVGNVSNLNIYELNINIDIVYPLPTPTAQLSIPSLVSLGCGNQTLVFSTKSISPDYSYSWTSASNPVNLNFSNYLSNQTSYSVEVPNYYLMSGLTVINITITSKTFKTSSWATSSIKIINEKQLSTVINVGNNVLYKPQSSLAIKPQILNSCGYSGLFTYNWFYTPTPEAPLVFESIWSLNSSNPAVLFIPSGAFKLDQAIVLQQSYMEVPYLGMLQ